MQRTLCTIQYLLAQHATSNCAHGIPSTSEPQVLPLRLASHATSPDSYGMLMIAGVGNFFQHAHLTPVAGMPQLTYVKEHS